MAALGGRPELSDGPGFAYARAPGGHHGAAARERLGDSPGTLHPTTRIPLDSERTHAMPSMSPSKQRPLTPISGPAVPTPAEQYRAAADALFRAAAECCRQHRRYSTLVEHEVSDEEQRFAVQTMSLCDEWLLHAMDDYESANGSAAEVKEQEWWRKGNMLWMATREYVRRHRLTENDSKRLSSAHDAAKLGTLTVDYDLEASALLGLRHAVEAYRKCRPEAELTAPPTPRPAA